MLRVAEYGSAGLELCDLKAQLETAEVQGLLYALVGWRDDEALNRAALERALAGYRADTSLFLYGARRENELVGLIGLEVRASAEMVIRHIVVAASHRASGVGRAMIGALREMGRPSRLVAETDRSAVGFYRRCGFCVRSLGEKYPGVERFWCVLAPCRKP